MQTQHTITQQHHLAELKRYREDSLRAQEEQLKRERIEIALNTLPQRFKEKDFSNFLVQCDAQAKVKEVAEKYVKTCKERLAKGTSPIFMGPPGTGKTLLSICIAKNLIRQGYRVVYQPSTLFLRLLQEKQFSSHGALSKALENYQNADFLILDEVTEGCGKGGGLCDWERHLLRCLIDLRYQMQRPTIVITNQDKQEMAHRLGEPVMGRLIENGAILAFTWQSYRQKGK